MFWQLLPQQITPEIRSASASPVVETLAYLWIPTDVEYTHKDRFVRVGLKVLLDLVGYLWLVSISPFCDSTATDQLLICVGFGLGNSRKLGLKLVKPFLELMFLDQ